MTSAAHREHLERRRADLAARIDTYTQSSIVTFWQAERMERAGEAAEDVAKVRHVAAWLEDRAHQLVVGVLAIDDELEEGEE